MAVVALNNLIVVMKFVMKMKIVLVVIVNVHVKSKVFWKIVQETEIVSIQVG